MRGPIGRPNGRGTRIVDGHRGHGFPQDIAGPVFANALAGNRDPVADAPITPAKFHGDAGPLQAFPARPSSPNGEANLDPRTVASPVVGSRIGALGPNSAPAPQKA